MMMTSYKGDMKFKKRWRFLATFVVVCILTGEVSVPVLANGNIEPNNAVISQEQTGGEWTSVSGGNSVSNEETVVGISNESVSGSDIGTKIELFASGTCGTNLTWTLTNEGLLTVKGTGEMADCFSETACQWTEYYNQVTSIVIEAGITSIGNYAFAAFSNLKEISVPDGIKSIGECAFIECESLEEVILPDSVNTIGARAFEDCTSLSNVTLSANLTFIGGSVFEKCEALSEINIPNSVTEIGVAAFYGCSSLTHIEIPHNVTNIGQVTFSNCTNLREVSIPVTIMSVDDSAFYICPNITDVYYGGSEEKWNAIFFGDDNNDLTTATIHYSDDSEDIVVEEVELLVSPSEYIAYYEFLEQSSWTFNSRDICLRIYLSDGNVIDATDDSEAWNEYSITYELKKLDGTNIEYDANSKLPIGEYCIVYLVNGKEYGLQSRYYVRSVTESDVYEMTLDQTIDLSAGTNGDTFLFSYSPRKAGKYKFTIIDTDSWVIIVKSESGEHVIGANSALVGPEIEMELEEGTTYYFNISAQSDMTSSVLLEQDGSGEAQELVLDQVSEVTVEANESTYYFSFVPSESKQYTLEVLPDELAWASVIYLRDSSGDIITSRGAHIIGVDLISNEKYTFEIRFSSTGEKETYEILLSEHYELIEGDEQEFSAGDVKEKYWFVFVPSISGAYQVKSEAVDSYQSVDIYESINTLNTNLIVGMGTRDPYDYRFYFEEGKKYYICVELEEACTLSVKVEKALEIQSTELIFNGNTETYYEFNTPWSTGFYPEGAVLNLNMEDGTSVTMRYPNNLFDEYRLSYEGTYRDGSYVYSDENGKYPVGKYRATFSCAGQDLGAYIDYEIKNACDIGKILTVDQNVLGIGEKEDYIKVVIDEDGDYNLKSSSVGTFELWNENFEFIGYESSFFAESGTYYARIKMNSAYELSLEKVVFEELVLAENEIVTIKEAGNSVSFSFIPEETGYYSLESFGNYDTYVTVKESNGSILCTDDDSGDSRNFKTYKKLTSGEKYIFEVRFLSSTETGAFEICLSKALEITEVIAEYSTRNTGKLYYGLNLRQYYSVANGLIFKTVYENGNVESVAFENGAHNYFYISISDKETGNYVNYNDNGYMPIGTYTVTIQSKADEKFTDTIEVEVLSPEKLDVVLTLDQAVSNLPGNNNGYVTYSCFKIEIPTAGRYSFISTDRNCYGALYDENMTPVLGANSYYSMDLINIEADSEATYYMVTYSPSSEAYAVEMQKMKRINKIECVTVYPEVLYPAVKNNSVYNVINNKIMLEITFEDGTSENYQVYGAGWNKHGFSWVLKNKSDQSVVDSGKYRNLPMGEYEIHITNAYSEAKCILPLNVVSEEKADILRLDTPINISTKYALYQLNIDEAGGYTIDLSENSRFMVQVYAAVEGGLYRYKSYSFQGEGNKYINLQTGTNYLYFTNYNAPQNLRINISRLPNIVKLDHACDDTHTFAYGDWGYSVGESVSGNKTYSGKTVSGSSNKRPMVSNSPVDYYVSGNKISKFNFDVTLEAEREDGSVIETFCNSFLWKAYNIIQSILNLDGSTVYTDQNGFVEIGDYIVKYEVGDVEVEIPFSVGESASVKDIRKSVVTFEKQNCTGEEIRPIPTITYNGESLELSKDYKITYENNIECGTATAMIKGINGFSGTLNVDFEIVPDDYSELYISEQPTSVICDVGENISFNVVAIGNNLRYLWQYTEPGIDEWKKCYLTGSTTDTLTVNAASHRIGMKFRCIVTDSSGETVTSDAAMLSLAASGIEIITQPINQSAELNSTVRFTVETNEGDYAYRWQYTEPGSDEWKKCYLSGYTTNTLTVKAASNRIGMKFRCIVTDPSGKTVTSDAAMLSLAVSGIEIITQPVSQRVELNSMVSFTVETNEGDYTYRWQYAEPGSDEWKKCYFTGSTTNTMTLKATPGRIGMKFRCVITGDNNALISNVVVLELLN